MSIQGSNVLRILDHNTFKFLVGDVSMIPVQTKDVARQVFIAESKSQAHFGDGKGILEDPRLAAAQIYIDDGKFLYDETFLFFSLIEGRKLDDAPHGIRRMNNASSSLHPLLYMYWQNVEVPKLP